MVVHNTSIFMHDGEPCHRPKVISEFRNKLAELNPIEKHKE